ncbi:hypothetical protein ACFL4T_02495 [candidate division KSB1 bacterium]
MDEEKNCRDRTLFCPLKESLQSHSTVGGFTFGGKDTKKNFVVTGQ